METLYTQYSVSDYPGNSKSQRIEDISVAFSNDNGCDCVVDMDECRAMVARYGAIMNKMIYNQSDLVSYIKEQYGVATAGSVEELRRFALLGPSKYVI
jgi:hypothetical protein